MNARHGVADQRYVPASAAAALASILLGSACSDFAGPGFGLEGRAVVQGLTFPTGLPQPGRMQATVVFPNLWFTRPLFLTAPPDGTDRIAVVEQDGLILIFPNDPNTTATSIFLDLRGVVRRVGGEEGLLGLAFDPDYRNNGLFYVNYIADGPPRTVVSRWRVSATDPNAADPTSEQVLLTFTQPYTNHNGGALAFGPDGMLYIASGDGGAGDDPHDNAQNLTNVLGKILRIQPDGSIPLDNPFAVATAGERGEIWAYGLRNPWRITFDRGTGTLWCGDVGQDSEEEIDIIVKGRNYGWRVYEGMQSNINPGALPPTAFEAPVHSYGRTDGVSVTGGYVYRGSEQPALVGAYVYADFASGRVWALVHDGTQLVSNTEIATVPSPASFGEDQAGELYICSFDGRVYQLEPTGGGGGPAAMPATLSAAGLFTDLASLTPTAGVIEYDVKAQLWSDHAAKRRWLALPGTSKIGFDPDAAWTFPVGTVLVKHFEIDLAPGQTRRLETRVLLRHLAGWQGYTYRWDQTGTDAVLLTAAADDTFVVLEPGGGQRTQTWHYPSGAECLSCHTTAAGHVLGVNARQLNRDFRYRRIADNQLRAWNHIGLFSTDIGTASQYATMPDPLDVTQPIAARARAYLDSNCAQCHLPLGPTPVNLDLRYATPVAQINAVGVLADNPVGGRLGALRVTAGAKELSDLWLRLGRRDAWAMPPLGSHLVDGAGVALVGQWLDEGAGN